jgi:hypothetical protein
MNLFEHLENITYGKKYYHKLTEDEKASINIYMINRFISMKYEYITLVNEIQQLNAPISTVYNLYISLIPKQKVFFKYLKKSIKEVKGDHTQLLAKIFEISEKEAKDYLDLLDKKQLEALSLQVNGIKEKKKK